MESEGYEQVVGSDKCFFIARLCHLLRVIKDGAHNDCFMRRKSRSISPRGRRSPSTTTRRRRSRSPTAKRYRRQRSRSSSLSPAHKSSSSSLGSVEQKTAIEKQRKEEEKK
ncbi:hypothetical protein A2U01_0029532, partial [Trifolium medium]|nr:hypothetical protein [Trifolium medium]